MTILSISSHIAYGFKIYDLSIDRLKDAIKSEMNITPCQFEGGHKTKEKWICAGDCLVFDFDCLNNFFLLFCYGLYYF